MKTKLTYCRIFYESSTEIQKANSLSPTFNFPLSFRLRLLGIGEVQINRFVEKKGEAKIKKK